MIIVCLSTHVLAQDLVPKVTVITKHYNVKDGLLMSRISNTVIDKQGFIWLATVKGIQFWDGQAFVTVFENIREDSDISLIYAHPKSGIYYLDSDRVYVLQVDSKTPELIFDKSNAELEYPVSLIRKSDFTELICDDSVFLFNAYDEISSESKRKHIYEPSLNRFFYLDERGDTLGYNYKFGFSVHIGREHCFHPIAKYRSNDYEVFDHKCYSLSYDGLWIDEILFPFPNEFIGRFHTYMYQNSPTTLMLGIDKHFYEFDFIAEKWVREFINANGEALLVNGFVDKIFQDSFDNFWIVTVNNGLLKFTENRVFSYYGQADKSKNFVKNIATNKSSNQVLVAGLNNGLFLYDTLGNFQGSLVSDDIQIKNVLGIYHLDENRFLINMYDNQKVYEININTYQDFSIKEIGGKKSKFSYYQCAVKTPDNKIVFGFDNVLVYDRMEQKISNNIPFNEQKFCGLYHEGKVYFGSDNRLLSLSYPALNRQAEIVIKEMGYLRGLANRSKSELYIAGDAGLAIYNISTSEIEWLYQDATIYSLVKDSDGTLWMGTDKGLVSMSEEGAFKVYLPEDGIQGYEFNTNAFDHTADDEIFIGGMNGVTSFYPQSITEVKDTLFLYYKSILVNNEPHFTNDISTEILDLNLKYNENSIIVDLGLLGTNESDYYEYSYRMNGELSEWIENGNNSKFLFNLSPGNYDILFKAGEPYESSNVQSLRMKLVINKPWWKSYLFYILVGLFIGSLIFLGFYLINRQRLQKAQYEWDVKYKLQEERINLSRDIHDHIGSQLSYLVSSIDNIDVNTTEHAEKVAHLSQYSRKIINDLRSLIWVLNKDEITMEELVLKIMDLIQIIHHSQASISVDFESSYNEMEPEILEAKLAGNLFRIVQELFHNTIKHARAEHIYLDIKITEERLLVSYRDDGIGFEEKQESKGNGLTNIQSRISSLGGLYKIETAHGNGVKYRFDIPRNTKNSV